MMKKTCMALTVALALGTALRAENGDPGISGTAVDVVNQIGSSQNQDVSTTSIAEGGSSWNDNTSNSASQVNINTSSNYETRTPPLSAFPPYLPYWTHGGWGTVKAYFPNGPTPNDTIYETTFDPENPEDMRELRSVLKAAPHAGLAEALGGMLNSVSAFVLGTPDRYHHGRGLEIVNSVTRDRRPEGKPLLVFIDANVDLGLLREEGYAYVGKVSVEGDVDRNWDQAYKAAVAEALLWNTDVLLVSGGMKGVTVGSNVTFPSAAAGYSQANYSLSLMGAKATGITEGKGKAVLSADAYRFSPERAERRRIPESLYNRIRSGYRPVSQKVDSAPVPMSLGASVPTPAVIPPERSNCATPARMTDVSPILQPRSQGATPDGQLLPGPEPQGAKQISQVPVHTMPQPQPAVGTPAVCSEAAVPELRVCLESPQGESSNDVSEPLKGGRPGGAGTAVRVASEPRRPDPTPARMSSRKPGITVSRQLLAMAGFQDPEQLEYVTVR
ncbi:MAG TPA: hypothetical protein VLI39_21140 [Sedimentisphaerales bacterium]|nr:hypothetical protein [Sedimentisphaerales bacterium]